jgi:hypothetical protein
MSAGVWVYCPHVRAYVCATRQGPMELGSGSSHVRSTVVVRTRLMSLFGETAVYDVQCFEEWDHGVVRLAVPHQGSVTIITTSVDSEGNEYVQESNSLAFEYNSPSLRSNEKDSTRPFVNAYGTDVVRIIGYAAPPRSRLPRRCWAVAACDARRHVCEQSPGISVWMGGWWCWGARPRLAPSVAALCSGCFVAYERMPHAADLPCRLSDPPARTPPPS